MPPSSSPSAAATVSRRLYIDWLRGVAVLVMILWHAIDSWTELANRTTAAFGIITFLAGWAAPLFLFLAGVSLPLAATARMAKGLDRRAASWLLQKRGWQVFLIAHLFRVQSFLLNPNGRWNALFKPDILNILGLTIVVASFIWGRARSTKDLIWGLVVPAIVVAGILTPLAPTWWWPTLLHPRLEGYIRVVNNNAVFSLFPASAYLLVGTFFGALLASHDDADKDFMRHTAGWGAALFAVGSMVFVPWPRVVSFWAAPIAIVTWRIGTMLLLLVLSWRALQTRVPSPSSPLMVFGRHSLFVYWVHVELAYGNFSHPLHHALPLPWSLTAYAIFTAGMFGLTLLWLRHGPRRPIVPPHMVAPTASAAVSAGFRVRGAS